MLEDKLRGIISRAGIEAGLAIWHSPSGARIAINGEQPFPMASVFKIPILAVACQQLAANELSLEQRVTLADADKSTGSGILPYFESGLCPSFRDLLTLMIIISDNTATDMVVELLGGPAVIEASMRRLGLPEISFKLCCKDLLRLLVPADVAALPSDQRRQWSLKNDILRDSLPFSRGPDNNVSTANAMNALLDRLLGDVFPAEIRAFALATLGKQQIKSRLPRFLPMGTRVAHKTGTLGGIRNDCGIISLGDKSHLILSLFVEWDEAALWDQPRARQERIHEVESAMGELALAAYERFAV